MISKVLIQKWTRMIRNDSVLHVKQAEGQYYSVSELAGYYNDFRAKVKNTHNFDANGIPMNIASYRKEKRQVYFPIAIFQYGLGAYDLWLESNEKKYYNIFMNIVNWAVSNQEHSGAWDTFGVLHYNNYYSSMAQGEGASLLARAYKETGDENYRCRCQKAIEFMLVPIEEGGTTDYSNGGMVLREYPEKPTVLNGWIFSAFGLFDYWLITKDVNIKETWVRTINQIEKSLVSFDAPCWSYYDEGHKYASPFYHSLHIELLKVLFKISGSKIMKQFEIKWTKDQDNKLKSGIAFVIKAFQKILEKNSSEGVFVE